MAVGLYGCLPKYWGADLFCCCSRSTLKSCLCQSKLLAVYTVILSSWCTAQLAVGAGLGQKCAILPEVRVDQDHEHQSLSVTRPSPPLQVGTSIAVLVRIWVRLLCSHLPKHTALATCLGCTKHCICETALRNLLSVSYQGDAEELNHFWNQESNLKWPCRAGLAPHPPTRLHLIPT